jgi:broad-specificity NMP kinase
MTPVGGPKECQFAHSWVGSIGEPGAPIGRARRYRSAGVLCVRSVRASVAPNAESVRRARIGIDVVALDEPAPFSSRVCWCREGYVRHDCGVPFTCEVCGRSVFPDLLPAVGDVLRCPHCANERPFVRPPLLVVTGAAGIGKSTLCAQLAGTIPGAVLLDADVFAADLVSVVPPNQDYPAFWRSMMRLAHELAQNDVVVVYFSTMLPEQVLVNTDVLTYFESAHFLCLTCPPAVLRSRLAGRAGSGAVAARIERWAEFNSALVATAGEIPTVTIVDAGQTTDQVTQEVRHWINTQLQRHGALKTDSTAEATALVQGRGERVPATHARGGSG